MTRDGIFFFFFLKLSNNKRWHQWDTGAADSGFVGMLVRRSKWKQHEMDKKPLRLICFENEAALMYRPIAGRLVQRGHNFPHMEGPALDSTMLPSPGNRRARMTSTGKLPSTSAFFFFSSQNCWDLILMLCVVLYFHAKILLYLNVFILLNVFKILVIIS